MSDRYLVFRDGLTMKRLMRKLSAHDRLERDTIELALIAATEHIEGDDTMDQVVDVDVLIAELQKRGWHWGI